MIFLDDNLGRSLKVVDWKIAEIKALDRLNKTKSLITISRQYL